MDSRSRRASGRNLTLSGSTEARLLGAGESLVKLRVHLFKRQVWSGIVQRTLNPCTDIRKRLNMLFAFSLPQAECISNGLAGRAIFASPDGCTKSAHHFRRYGDGQFFSYVDSHGVTFITICNVAENWGAVTAGPIARGHA